MKIENGTYVPKEEIKNQEMLDNVVAAFEKVGFYKDQSFRVDLNRLSVCFIGVGVACGAVCYVKRLAFNPITYNKLMELAGMSERRPKVGDTVYVTSEVMSCNARHESARLISESYCEVASIFTHDDIDFCVLKNRVSSYNVLNLDWCISDGSIIKDKPKTPEQLLREDIEKTLSGNPSLDYGIDMLLEKFNVTRK